MGMARRLTTVWIAGKTGGCAVCLYALALLAFPQHRTSAAEQAGQPADVAANAGAATAYADGLSLAEAKRIALADNPDIAAALSRIDDAVALLQETRASYFPTVGLSGSAVHTHKAPADVSGSGSDPDQTYGVALEASWLVFDGYQRRFNVLASRYGRDASEHELHDVQRVLLQSVASSFFSALLYREIMDVQQQDADFNRELSQETQTRFDAGAVAKSEVLNFKIRKATADTNYIGAKRDYQTYTMVLAQLLGLPDGRLPEGVELVSPLAEGGLVALPDFVTELSHACEQRPDLRVLEANRGQLEAELSAARGEYWPSVELEASYGEKRKNNARFNDERDASAYIGVAASWTLFSGGGRKHACAQIRAQIAEVSHEMRQLRNTIASNLHQQLNNARATREQFLLRQEVDGMSDEVRKLVRNEYLAGRTSLTRLNEAQNDRVQASGELALARIRYWQALEDIAAISGRNLAGMQ